MFQFELQRVTEVKVTLERKKYKYAYSFLFISQLRRGDIKHILKINRLIQVTILFNLGQRNGEKILIETAGDSEIKKYEAIKSINKINQK